MKNRIKRRYGPIEAACFLLIFVGLACSHPPATIQVHPQKLSFQKKGQSKRLNVTVMDARGNPLQKVQPKYASSDEKVARVDAGGRVLAEGSGDAVITVRAGKAQAKINVTVSIVKTLSLSLPNPALRQLSGPVNTVVPLKVTALDDKGRPIPQDRVHFQSNNAAVASVDAKGKLTLLSSGTVTVTAKADDKEAELTVPVSIWSPLAVKLDKRKVTVERGGSYKIKYTVLSTQGLPIPFPATFTSSNENVARVTDQGEVKGLSKGKATVTILAGKVFNTLTVTVR
jgi:uncharacterized protein YjdB